MRVNMTEGMVSSEIGLTADRFHISAAIQPGNSGGPVFDDRGNLLGLVVSKLLPEVVQTSGSAVTFLPENVNFAIDAWPLIHAAKSLGFEFPETENQLVVAPTALGKLAHHVCVEVERWE
jgi:serine protease Do